MNWNRWRRFAWAQVRDLRILLREFGGSILGFSLLLLVGAWVLMSFHHRLEGEPELDFGRAVYTVFTLIFFETQMQFPDEPGLRLMFFLVPVVGLAFLGEGLARFAVLVFNKQMRGEAWQRVLASTYSRHIILCGLGHVGYRVAEELLRLGEDFVVIAKESDFVDLVRRREVPVLLGDARDEVLLEQANVEKARTIVICTDNDLANLEVALNARSRNPKIRILVRMFDGRLAKKVESAFGIHMAFSTSQLAAPAVALAAVDKSVLHSFYVGDQLLTVVELVVQAGSVFAGRTLEEVEKEMEVTVVVHRRGTALTTHPAADTLLEQGDTLILLCSHDKLGALEKGGLVASGVS